jgi:hypothetical protein
MQITICIRFAPSAHIVAQFKQCYNLHINYLLPCYMRLKLPAIGVGLVLIVFPVLASAQSVQANSSGDTPLITLLTLLVQVLEAELQELIGANQGSVGSNSPSPTTGYDSQFTPLTATLTVDGVAVTAQAGQTASGVAMHGWSPNPNGSHLLYTFSDSGTGQNIVCTQTVNGTGAGTVSSTLFGQTLNMDSVATSPPSSITTQSLTCTDSAGQQATVEYTIQPMSPSGLVKG